MADTEGTSGFFARWSQRKSQARRDAVIAEPRVTESTGDTPVSAEQGMPPPTLERAAEAAPASPSEAQSEAPVGAERPAPTLSDVAQLTRDSDFARFVGGGVQTEVKNAALKKLFTDPRFNVMDGLDVYIDDYGIPSPLPQSMLVKMAQAKFLGLLTETTEEKIGCPPDSLMQDEDSVVPAVVVADVPPADRIVPNEDADLQLQSHDDAGRPGTAPGAREDAGREY
jgi:hypothetical protein